MGRMNGQMSVAKVATATPTVQTVSVDNFSKLALTSSFFLSWSSRGCRETQGGVAVATFATPNGHRHGQVIA